MTIFFCSDHHLFHENMLKFKKSGSEALVRPGFDSIEHLHEVVVERHNSRVSTSDKVYFLGDVTMKYGEPFRLLMQRLNGKKRLLLGNHDKLKGTNLANFFEKVELWRVFRDEGFVCSHVPLSPDSFPGTTRYNVHGHVHYKTLPDRRYVNVSMEAIDFTPVSMEEIVREIEKRDR